MEDPRPHGSGHLLNVNHFLYYISLCGSECAFKAVVLTEVNRVNMPPCRPRILVVSAYKTGLVTFSCDRVRYASASSE